MGDAIADNVDEVAESYAGWVHGGREGEAAMDCTFIRQEGYSVTMPGWVFKTGATGTGYYKEGHPEKVPINLQEAVEPSKRVAPLNIKLDELIKGKEATNIVGDLVEAEMGDEVKQEKVGEEKRNRQGWAKVRLQAEERFDEFTAGSKVKLKDTSHRKLGLRALETANPNAWAGAKQILAESGADFIAIQEARVDQEEVADNEAAAKTLKWRASITPCLYGEGGGKSAGAAVCCRSHVGMGSACEDIILPAELQGRFLVRQMGGDMQRRVQLCERISTQWDWHHSQAELGLASSGRRGTEDVERAVGARS